MKKLFMAPLAFLAMGAALAVAMSPVDQLNGELQKILAPFQNESTSASLSFSRIETDAKRALGVAASALFRKTGPANSLEINLAEVSYEYGDGSAPRTTANGVVKIDLTKILPQEDLNHFLPNLEVIIADIAGGFTAEYGDAVSVVAEITERNQDGEGNYISIKGNLSFAFDFAKLPENVEAKSIPVSSGNVLVGLDVNSGLSFAGTIVSNPAYEGFEEGHMGLKELLDGFLARDPGLMRQVQELFSQLNNFAGQLVGAEN